MVTISQQKDALFHKDTAKLTGFGWIEELGDIYARRDDHETGFRWIESLSLHFSISRTSLGARMTMATDNVSFMSRANVEE